MKNKTRSVRKNKSIASSKGEMALFTDIRNLIISTREKVAQSVNTGLVLLYWHIGKRILDESLSNQRAEYGKKIINKLSEELTLEFGKGFNTKALFHMVQFAGSFSDIKIVSALGRQLGWTHFRMLIYLKDPIKRDFYAEMCRLEHWSTRTLEKKIQSMLFERTAISKKPHELIKQELKQLHKEDKLTPDLVFRDPYLLDFLGLKDTYAEKDLESAILKEMESFLLELGTDFTFVARQKRITIDNEDYYLDLLFYHRRLKRLVALELKLGKFKAADKGQMELYLRWLEKHMKIEGEEAPIGLILCADKLDEHVELLELEKSGIRVATYLTEYISPVKLEKKLHQAILFAKKRFQ